MYEADGWIIDADLTMKEVHQIQTLNVMDSDSAIYPLFARVIKAWPYAPLDPANVASYEDLRISQMGELMTRLSAAFQQLLGTIAKPA